MKSTTLTIHTAALASLAQDLIAEDLPGVSTIFWNGRVHGIERLHSELVRWARRPEQVERVASAGVAAGSAETRLDASFDGGAEYDVSAATKPTAGAFLAAELPAAEPVYRVSDLATMPTPLPQTGIKVADITRVQRELASLAASGDKDLAAACVRAQAVIEGLLAGLAVEQLS